MYCGKALLLIFFFIGTTKYSYSQEVDTNKIILNSKMLLTEYLNSFEDKEYYHAFVEFQPEIQFLKVHNAPEDRFVFYKIIVKNTTVVTTKERSETKEIIIKRPFFNAYNGVVYFACDVITNKIYRLNGFKHNDIGEFIHFLTNDLSYLIDSKINCRNIEDYFSIEEIDIKCMCKSIKGKKPCFTPITWSYLNKISN